MAATADRKPTLILLHPAGRGGRTWHKVAPLFTDAFEVLTPDLPGFAGRPGPFRMSTATREIAELAAAHNPPVALVGLSLGGSVAASVAAEHPHVVSRLAMSAPAIRSTGHERVIRWYRRVPGWLVRRVTDLPDRAAWLALVDELVATDLTDTLPRISAPTLVLCGSRDTANLADAHLAADTIANARFLLVPHMGHAWPVTQPRLFAKVVTPFLTMPAPADRR
ncbi:MAG TPA: alpha/beta fold hydrolase [Micromonosporaceae bacterium]|jgi:3-oxoadipate enol-lactonase/4-carboxymuconolactone decarboxylase|nr:alpha/beta fold hydrolase [Micromonosporaceae bacterium]